MPNDELDCEPTKGFNNGQFWELLPPLISLKCYLPMTKFNFLNNGSNRKKCANDNLNNDV